MQTSGVAAMPTFHNASAVAAVQGRTLIGPQGACAVPAEYVPGRISVVMPCFNSARFVREAIGSVRGQSYGDVELIVVDDGSTDDSLSILESQGNAIRLIRQSRRGPYPARNAGLAVSSGEFVAFLDSDDLWRPDALQKLHGALARHGTDLAYCGWQNVGDSFSNEPFVPPAYEKGDPIEQFLRSCPWPIHAALLRRSLVRRLGGFSERRFSSMDYDFWLRALALTRNMVRVPEVLATYRWHGAGQISAVKSRQVLDALAVQTDFIASHPDLIAHLSRARLRELTDGRVLDQAYRALWKRDLESAHALLRHCARTRAFGIAHVPQVVSSLLPLPAFRWLVGLADRKKS